MAVLFSSDCPFKLIVHLAHRSLLFFPSVLFRTYAQLSRLLYGYKNFLKLVTLFRLWLVQFRTHLLNLFFSSNSLKSAKLLLQKNFFLQKIGGPAYRGSGSTWKGKLTNLLRWFLLQHVTYSHVHVTYSHKHETYSHVHVTYSLKHVTYSHVHVKYSHKDVIYLHKHVTFLQIHVTYSQGHVTYLHRHVTYSHGHVTFLHWQITLRNKTVGRAKTASFVQNYRFLKQTLNSREISNKRSSRLKL